MIKMDIDVLVSLANQSAADGCEYMANNADEGHVWERQENKRQCQSDRKYLGEQQKKISLLPSDGMSAAEPQTWVEHANL